MLKKSVLSLYRMDSGNELRLSRLGSKHLYLVNHFVGPILKFCVCVCVQLKDNMFVFLLRL